MSSPKIKPNIGTEADVARTKQFFAFLQGTVPEGYTIDPADVPTMNADQAWTVVWYVQQSLNGFPDCVDRCDVCGSIYHAWVEGETLDYEPHPYSFCDACKATEAFTAKKAKQPADD